SEKIADVYHYYQAEKILNGEEDIEVALTNDVSSCRENTEYRKDYQLFECEWEGSRVYYAFAKNTLHEAKQVTVHLELLGQNQEAIYTIASKEMNLQPNEVTKVVFDTGIFDQPTW